MSSTKSPQRNKRHALDGDHVTAAEYRHSFRKQWPRKKARINRSFRRKVRQLLQPEDDAQAAAAVHRKPMEKRDVVSVRERIRFTQLKRRAMVGAHKARRAKADDT